MPAFIRPSLQEFAAYSAHALADGDTLPAVIDQLDTNESSYDLPEPLKEKLAWTYQHHISANRYPDGHHADLKAAIAQYVAGPGGECSGVTEAHVSVGNGSDEIIRSILLATCLGRDGAILVAEPTFSMYRILAETLGIEVVRIGRDEATFAVDIAAAQAAIAQANTPIRVVFMVSPNSPTGNGLSAEEIAWLKALPEDILVVVDEAYFEFCQETTVAEAIARPNWMVTRTFSKAFRLAAHRVGYAIAAPQIIQVLEKVRLPYNLPSFSQAAATLMLRHAEDVLGKVAETRQERAKVLTAMAAMAGLHAWPSDANFIYCRPTARPLTDCFEQLYHLGTRVRQTGGGLRVTVGTPAENDRTLAHLRTVLQAD